MHNYKNKKICVVGGDLRQKKCGEYLTKKGFRVFDFSHTDEKICENLKNADYVLLPLPVTYDNVNVNAPFIKNKIPLSLIYENISENTVVFGGMFKENLKEKFPRVFDYTKNEKFLLENAKITVEGALDIIFSEIPISIYKSNFLITGNGRIGKLLSETVSGLGANVSVAARKDSDFAWIELNGYTPIKYEKLTEKIGDFDIIVNTVPYQIFDKSLIMKISKDALYLDLASKPGGADMTVMEQKGIKAIHALSLPGKTAPVTSGMIISETITNMMDEEFKYE